MPIPTTLTIIARNEEPTLPACLASIAGLVDEIIVVDTGSTDRTKEIGKEKERKGDIVLYFSLTQCAGCRRLSNATT
jgi:glycosyltransferase involved in cell wall biosynthesis